MHALCGQLKQYWKRNVQAESVAVIICAAVRVVLTQELSKAIKIPLISVDIITWMIWCLGHYINQSMIMIDPKKILNIFVILKFWVKNYHLKDSPHLNHFFFLISSLDWKLKVLPGRERETGECRSLLHFPPQCAMVTFFFFPSRSIC